MGKNKGFKTIQYKAPPEKYLVVVNAWNLNLEYIERTDWKTIATWFEIMLRDENPGVRVTSMFYQKTHRNIIVQLPSDVKNVHYYLGEHFYREFLVKGNPQDQNTALMYEYDYQRFGDPSKRNWTEIYPPYVPIPSNFPIRQPYPPPLPSDKPPPPNSYAQKIGAEVYDELIKRFAALANLQLKSAMVADRASVATNPAADFQRIEKANCASSSSQSSRELPSTSQVARERSNVSHTNDIPNPDHPRFAPYDPPSHYTTQLKATLATQEKTSEVLPVKKMDPYEEEEVAQSLLRSLSPVKREGTAATIDTLLSTDFEVKEEEKPWIKDEDQSEQVNEDEDDYEPSAELMALLGTLPPEVIQPEISFSSAKSVPRVKPEPVDELMPSDDLASPVFRLQSVHPMREQVHLKSEYKNDVGELRIKPEPIDDPMPEYEPSEELLAALNSLSPELLAPVHPDHRENAVEHKREAGRRSSSSETMRSTPFGVKQELLDPSYLPRFDNPYVKPLIKSEPKDDRLGPDFPQQRDADAGPSRHARRRPNVFGDEPPLPPVRPPQNTPQQSSYFPTAPITSERRDPRVASRAHFWPDGYEPSRDPRRAAQQPMASSAHRTKREYEHPAPTPQKRTKREYE